MKIAILLPLLACVSLAFAQSAPVSRPTTASAPAPGAIKLPNVTLQGVTVPDGGTLLLGGQRLAAEVEPKPATASSPATTSAPAVDPAAYKLLVQLEKAGEKYATLSAKIEYTVTNPEVASTEVRNGTVAFQQARDDKPAKFCIYFADVKYDTGPVLAEKLEYAFDGMWLTISKGKIKNMTRKQVAAPGEKVEPLKLGKGPFPLPFGQKADDVIKMFNATTRPARGTDPKNTAYLELTPLKGHERDYDFSRLQVWIDQETNLPAKIISLDAAKNLKTILFKETKAGQELDPKIFYPAKPLDWEEVKEPLENPKHQ